MSNPIIAPRDQRTSLHSGDLRLPLEVLLCCSQATSNSLLSPLQNMHNGFLSLSNLPPTTYIPYATILFSLFLCVLFLFQRIVCVQILPRPSPFITHGTPYFLYEPHTQSSPLPSTSVLMER